MPNKLLLLLSFQVKAADEDSEQNGYLAYEIVDSEQGDGGYFHIDQDTGVIWTARDLYSAENKILSFIVRASDNGAPVRHTDVMVTLQIIGVNNNPPVFEKVRKRNNTRLAVLNFLRIFSLNCS